MKITIGRFIKRKEDYDSENIICPIEDYNRDKYLNRRVLFRILFIILYGFGFGYMLAFNTSSINDIKMSVRNFVLFYIVSFYLIQIPHEFIHTIFYPAPFKNHKNSLVFFNKKRIVTTELEENINPFMLCLSLITPFILFSILPLIAIEYIGFDLYLYCLSFANAILSSDDLLNIILQLFVRSTGGTKKLFVIPNNYDYLIAVDDSNYVDETISDETISCEEKTIIKDDNENNPITDNPISDKDVEENGESNAIAENENAEIEMDIKIEIDDDKLNDNSKSESEDEIETDTEEVNQEISDNIGILNNE